MSEKEQHVESSSEGVPPGDRPDTEVDAAVARSRLREQRREARRWWLKLFLQPLLLLAAGALLLAGLGVVQRLGWIPTTDAGSAARNTAAPDGPQRYICPMMCTPPQSEPGRCPVCAMELVPAAAGGAGAEGEDLRIDPVARRLANIQTVPVASVHTGRTVRAVGELQYDEGTLKTLSAYVDGRLDRLYADYTGVEVQQGDRLALLYSPRLQSGQAELLLAKKAMDEGRHATTTRAVTSRRDLYESTRRRLIQLGMTESQVEQLEQEGRASSRMHLLAPISGTVIEKLAVEGQYVKEGEAIYRLADLSTVWLMLELFPEDAAAVRYGQRVEAEVQSLPGEHFTGRVAFVDRHVDPETRTVGVRVVIPNPAGRLRVGDYAKARVEIPLGGDADPSARKIYDPELASKWISPRHPHVVASSPGACPVCGVNLVPAAHYGFTDQPQVQGEALVVPRDAVLMAGNHSVVYVESEPGRFELRRVVLGPRVGEQIVILEGVRAGEHVATRGNFLIDSQMQLAGRPSLIDPLRSAGPGAHHAEAVAAIARLSPDDQALAYRQGICPVSEKRLGEMGTPAKVQLEENTVLICCESCRERLLAEPRRYLERLAEHEAESDAATSEMDLPPIGVPETLEPASNPAPDGPAAQFPPAPGASERVIQVPSDFGGAEASQR